VSIVDLQDGGFRLLANRRGSQVRTNRALRWAATVALVVTIAISVDVYRRHLSPSQTQGMVAFLIFIGGLWFVSLIGSTPPFVKVTGDRVTVRGDFQSRQSIQRSDLDHVFRGQGIWGRYRRWTPAYFLVTRDNTPQIMLVAGDFTEDGMIELAKRLGVPIQGDFSVQVS
jgi:hypothetical protein